MKKKKISLISSLHYLKLLCRSLLFVLAVVMYILSKLKNSGEMFSGFEKEYWLLALIWIIYTTEMVCRFFPSRFESMGCQKQFERNYQPTNEGETPKLLSWKRTVTVAVVWLLLNGIIGMLYYAKIIDAGILVLISLAYSVCDMIYILFFCPF